MIIIPAIDIREKRVVRLRQGDFAKETFYSGDPVEVAAKWARCGAKLLHLVDLDGALAGEPKNLDVIEKIIKEVKVPVELGGGLRTERAVEIAISKGVSRVIIGTRACTDTEFVKRLVDKYKNKIVVGIDAAGEDVVVSGWTEKTALKAIDFARQVESLGVSTIIYTNVLKDGTLESPQLDDVKRMVDSVKIDVIISGGISSLQDIVDIKSLARKNISGIITGKALYEGRFDLDKAIEIVKD